MSEREIAMLESNIDQEIAECDAWFAAASEGDRLSVFNFNQLHKGTPIEEVSSRFATLAFMQATVRHFKPKEKS